MFKRKKLTLCGMNFILEAFSFNWCTLTLPLVLLEASYFCLHYFLLLLLCRNSESAVPYKCVTEKNTPWKVIQLLSTLTLSKLIHTSVYHSAIHQSLFYQQKFGIPNLWSWFEILQENYITYSVIWSPGINFLDINQSYPALVTLQLCLSLLICWVFFFGTVKERIKRYIT